MRTPRVPVILQMSALECGAACLAMILSYFGRKTPLTECRDECDPGRDGITAQTILTAARRFGLVSKAFAVQAAGAQSVAVPCILFWNRSHFVVLERLGSSGADIVDPGEGRRTISLREFWERFSGVALCFEPGPEFRPEEHHVSSPLWNYFTGMLRVPGARGVLAAVAAASLALQVFGFATPLLTKVLVDEVLPHTNPGMMGLLLWGSIAAALMQAVMGFVRARLLVRLESRLDSELMSAFFGHLLKLPFRFFQVRTAGDLLIRLSSNSAIREALAGSTISSLLDGSLVLAFLAALAYVSPLFGATAFALAALQAAILLATAAPLHRLAEAGMSASSASQSYLVEVLMGIGTVKACGAESAAMGRWSGLFEQQLRASERRSRYGARVDTLLAAVRTLSSLALLWLGAVLVLDRSLSLGAMLAANGLAAMLLQPVNSLVASWQRVQLARAHAGRIADVMQAEPEQTAAPRPLPPLTGAIELRNVSFRYSAHAPDVLRNVSLSIHPGQKVALVGRTGCGKSTLARLLLGLYRPTEGEIRYDGVDLASLDLPSLRRQWGSALQDPFLFQGSIRDNIAFPNSGLSDDEVASAARIAELHRDLERMPMGLETRLQELGYGLSGGQRQRIAIARAVAAKPKFLLFDEATSHLDTVTERAVDRNLDSLACTRVVIAHRLSTVRNADLIVVLDEGQIVETGSHRQLLDRGGLYARLAGTKEHC